MSTDVPCLRHLAPLVTKTGEATPKVENGTSSQLNLPHGSKQKRVMKTLKTKKTEMLRRNGPVVKSVESVLRLE